MPVSDPNTLRGVETMGALLPGRGRGVYGLGALLLVTLAVLSGCASVAPVVKIGLVGPFEGRHRAVGYDVIYSARLAVRQLNAAGGVAGYRVALVALDDSGELDLAAGTAEALVIDPKVVAVVGHWLAGTSTVAAPIYRRAGLPHLVGGEAPFGPSDPEQLAASFRSDYEETTPFDETAGPYAGAAYDAFQLLWQALKMAAGEEGQIDRAGVAKALQRLERSGPEGGKMTDD
jgi:ABC-type branched-subunit amino acid transport system substrate-binding protein